MYGMSRGVHDRADQVTRAAERLAKIRKKPEDRSRDQTEQDGSRDQNRPHQWPRHTSTVPFPPHASDRAVLEEASPVKKMPAMRSRRRKGEKINVTIIAKQDRREPLPPTDRQRRMVDRPVRRQGRQPPALPRVPA